MLASSESFAENTENGRKPRLKFCRFFATKQGCRNGSACKFLHQKQDELTSGKGTKSPGPQLGENISEDRPATYRKSTPEVTESPEETENVTIVTDIPNKRAQNEVCKFYARSKRCWYGDRCKFLHVYAGTGKRQKSQTDQPGKDKDVPGPEVSKAKSDACDDSDPAGAEVHPEVSDNTTKDVESKKKKPRPKPVCRYWRAGHCRLADRCRYRHPDTTSRAAGSLHTEDDSTVDPNLGKAAQQEEGIQGHIEKVPMKKPVPVKPELLLDQLDDEAIARLRNTEIEQLKKRFPKAVVGQDMDDGSEFYVVQFSSSDPDWPYDVKEVTLQVRFPEGYPKEMMSIIMPADQPLPDPLRRCIMFGIRDWVKNKHNSLAADGKTQLVFRPLLRWLDRNLEDLFTEGLKQFQRELMAQAAGLEFIPASHLQEALPGSQMSDSEKEEEEDDEPTELLRERTEEDNKENINSDNQYERDEEDNEVKADHNVNPYKEPAKKGTEVKLHNLQLREGASTMRCLKVKVIIQCTRCKGSTEVHTPADVLNSVSCGRCNSEQLVAWRPAMLHQFNAVMGYLDLQGCVAFDLIFPDCQFMLGCLNCSKEMKLEGLAVGQVKDTWCLHCHQKMRVAAETVKFQQLQPNLDLDNQKVRLVVQRTKKVAKDPAIQEGKPLPFEGTCKHYKKSYRWFRFPCCGKTYPCDLCHEDKENHEMIFANRTVCGFCCKEQPYSPDRPCVLCQSSMTKKTSTHWEGGSGCRDKVKMSKGDKQKYSGSTKVLSKKSQQKNENKGKKVTKLRHT